ncbi:hypothetical protein [Paenibacillus sp. Leaf72]|uniref:hypothetical protein n=1 Tax=Paenibacillus sp. Leaf72 TaxID=1736234 RepID=UPI0006F65F10|nr:hypothetical protein [Paenibacillus sp. Leaf72]KQN96896.1 hypothetical protein ASF12_22775 [Paenibacillus sp. Leaf72]
MKSAAVIKGEIFHNGQEGDKYKTRKVTGFDDNNGVNYIDSTGRIGNCSLAQFCKWSKGTVRW